MLFSRNREFRKLRKAPRDAAVHESLFRMHHENPVEFVCQLLWAIRKAKKRRKAAKNETHLPHSGFDNPFRQTWVNTIHKERVQPLKYVIPEQKSALIREIQTAEQEGLMVRAVGKGHSFSDVANATDVLVDMLGLNRLLDLETDTLKGDLPTDLLVNCEAGILVKDLNLGLDKKGLAIPTMAAFDQETLYGAIATSTHGTGIRLEGMTAMVRSMDLISTGGKCYRLEPTNGITDPEAFHNKYPDGSVTLIQDDDKFYSTVVGFGLMGVVYSLVIETVRTHYLKQRLWLTNWRTIKPKLEDGSFFTEINPQGDKVGKDPTTGEYLPSRAQVFVNPYPTKKYWDKELDHTCVVQVQTNISKEEYDKLVGEEPKHAIKLFEFLKEILSNGSHGTHVEHTAQEDKVSKIEEVLEDLILAFMNDHPEITPAVIDVSMVALLSGSGKIGKSFEVLNQGKLAFKNDGYSIEPGFAVDEQHTYLAGVQKIFDVMAVSAKDHAYLTAPMCMRFVKQSHCYMSPEFEQTTCMIDVPSLLGTIGDDQILDRLQLELLPVGARPHWGKICNRISGRELIGKMYKKFPEFLETVDFFNPAGTFNSSFSYRTGISEKKFPVVSAK